MDAAYAKARKPKPTAKTMCTAMDSVRNQLKGVPNDAVGVHEVPADNTMKSLAAHGHRQYVSRLHSNCCSY